MARSRFADTTNTWAVKNACCVWDFTLKVTDEYTVDVVLEKIKSMCKKWCFQQEEGESGYIHYQGRVSLKVKDRKPAKPFNEWRWSVTSSENADNDFYACKEDTRVNGPWKDTDEPPLYIPRQIREIPELFSWQQQVADTCDTWDPRNVNLIFDPIGCTGKTFIKGYLRAHNKGRPIPFCNDYKDIMRMVMDMPTSNCYLIDIPRAINKDKLFQLFAGIESIKDGYAYDDRYRFQEKYFDSPVVWVFTNTFPDLSLLSADRWKIWTIEDRKLVPYVE